MLAEYSGCGTIGRFAKADWGLILFWLIFFCLLATVDVWFWLLPKILAVTCIGLFIFWKAFVKWCVKKHNAKTN